MLVATGIIGGPGKGLFQLLKNSTRLDFDYILCNFNATYMKSDNHEFFKRAAELNIPINLIKQKWTIDPYIICRAEKIRKARHCNIIQTHGYKPNVIGFFLRRLTSTPWVAFAHGYTNDNRTMRIYNRMDAWLLRHADCVVAVSKSMERLLITKGVRPNKIKIIHNAIDKSELMSNADPDEIRKELGISNTDHVVAVLGRLGPEKGQIVFLKAFKNVLRTIPKVKALIIGDGQEKENLINFCNRAHIIDHVIFAGYKNHVANYLQVIDLIVIPSFSEGFPNVLLEGMISGIPVIATSVGGIPEILNSNNGVLVPAGDPNHLEKDIVRLLSNPGDMESLAKRAKDSISGFFSPERRAEEIVKLYHTVLRQ